MSKLDDILAEIDKGYVAKPYKQEIKDLFLELIGEDEDIVLQGSTVEKEIALDKNLLRKELRRKVEEL